MKCWRFGVLGGGFIYAAGENEESAHKKARKLVVERFLGLDGFSSRAGYMKDGTAAYFKAA